jgi:hypothetical protein
MTKISMKALLGASTAAVIAVISLTSAAHAQGQPGTMNGEPGYTNAAPQMGPADQPAGMAPAPQQNGYGPQQNAYVPPQPGTTEPSQLHQMDPRYPGPKLH